MDGGRVVVLLTLAFLAVGCSSEPDAPFPNWLSETQPGRASTMSDPFKELASAASDAERKSGDLLRRVSFTPGQRSQLIDALAAPLDTAARASRQVVVMPERAADPFEVLPYQRGWRMLGRAMAWKVERAVAAEDYDSAIDWTISATRFGLALTAGAASDAALGYSTIDEASAAMMPVVARLTPDRLRKLGTGIEAALKGRPPVDHVIVNERISMLRAIQHIQEKYRDRKLGTLADELGKDIDPAVDFLEKLRTKSPRRRADYFAHFAEEAERWAEHFGRALKQNARQRDAASPIDLRNERPWRRFAKHFFQSLEPVIGMRDETLARTRLLGLSALLLAECKANRMAPSTLTGISGDLKTDPYSGYPLVYRPEGDRFLLYSIGPDLKDDGGETDESGIAPDLRLEGHAY